MFTVLSVYFRHSVITDNKWDSLRVSSPECSCGGAGKGRRACNLNSTSNSPVASRRLSCQIFANQCEAETSANVNQHWKTRAKGNDVTTSVISAYQHFASTFWMQMFKFQRRRELARRLSETERSIKSQTLLCTWLERCSTRDVMKPEFSREESSPWHPTHISGSV